MVPVGRYATTNEDQPLREAILKLRELYRDAESGEYSEAGHRTCLVLDHTSALVGILDIRSILETLIPEISGTLARKLSSLEISVALAEGDSKDREEITASLAQRVMLHAQIPVRDMMLKVRGKGLQADDFLVQGLKTMHRLKVTVMPVYDGDDLVGVLRDSDLFLAVTDILNQQTQEQQEMA